MSQLGEVCGIGMSTPFETEIRIEVDHEKELEAFNKVINKDTLTLLRRVIDNWNELSTNPEQTMCMTDHCHMDVDETECLMIGIENLLKGNK